METKFMPFEIKNLENGKPIGITINGIEYDLIPKSKIKKPEWKDFGKIEGYYIESNCYISRYLIAFTRNNNKNLWPTKEEAQAALALSQLLQWRNKYNEGWQRTDVSGGVYGIYRNYTGELFCNTSLGYRSLQFKNEEIAIKFFNDFKELLEIAKPLL